MRSWVSQEKKMKHQLINFSEEISQPSYREKIKEKQQQNKIVPINTEITDSSELQDTFKNPVEEANFKNEVSTKINMIVSLDKEYKEYSELIKQCDLDGKNAELNQKNLSEMKIGFFTGKKNYQALVGVTGDLAKGQRNLVKLQAKQFELQGYIIEALKALFALATSSLAANRTVYRRLEMELNGASSEELSEYARNEVLNIMNQLNEQQDEMSKRKKMQEQLHQHDDIINKQETLIKSQQDKISSINSEVSTLKEELSELKKQNKKYMSVPKPEKRIEDITNNHVKEEKNTDITSVNEQKEVYNTFSEDKRKGNKSNKLVLIIMILIIFGLLGLVGFLLFKSYLA